MLDTGGTLAARSVVIANQVGSSGRLVLGVFGMPGTLNAATVAFGAAPASILIDSSDVVS